MCVFVPSICGLLYLRALVELRRVERDVAPRVDERHAPKLAGEAVEAERAFHVPSGDTRVHVAVLDRAAARLDGADVGRASLGPCYASRAAAQDRRRHRPLRRRRLAARRQDARPVVERRHAVECEGAAAARQPRWGGTMRRRAAGAPMERLAAGLGWAHRREWAPYLEGSRPQHCITAFTTARSCDTRIGAPSSPRKAGVEGAECSTSCL